MILALLTLTTPLLLGGLSLLALPLIAHWLHRHSRRTLVFPSIALLVQTVAQQSQFHRLKRWLLLALRLFAIACIVLAFTRPVWQSADAGTGVTEGSSAAVVFLVDVSASTGRRHDGLVELEALKAAAAEILRDLQPGRDVAGIIIADAAPRSVFPRLSANLTGLTSELNRLAPTYERADLQTALAAAGKLLETHTGPRRLYILSDLQRSNWSEVLEASRPGESLPSDVQVSVIARTGATPNVSLSRPRRFPTLPLSGEPFDVTVSVGNHSPTTRQVRLICERTAGDGTGTILGRDEQTVALTANERRDVSFRVASLDEERQFVRLEAVGEDGLEADNVAWLVVETVARTPVLVLSDDDPQEPGSAGYYLSRALAPTAESPTRFLPAHLRTAELTAERVSGAAVIVVGYLGALNEPQAGILANFVRQGGGLVIFSGEGPVDRNLQALAAAGAGGLLPWSPGPRRLASVREPRRLGNGRWQSRWLRAFDEQSQLALQTIQFPRVWAAGAISPAAEVLLHFDDGTPAVGVRAVERGTIVVCNFSPESTTSDLARHGAFVAFTQMMVQAAVPEAREQSQPLVGQSWNWSSRFSESETVGLKAVGPAGQALALTTRNTGNGYAPQLPRTSRPGIYRLERRGVVLEATAVSLDEREGPLDRLAAADVEQRLAASGTNIVTLEQDGRPPPLRGRPLWGEFLSAALAAIALELFLLGWWRR